MIDVSDCRCIDCNSALRAVQACKGTDIVESAYACANCGKTYDYVWGAPFFVEFEKTDFCGLIEMAANSEQASPHSPEDLEAFNVALAGYHAAPDRAAFADTVDPARRRWLAVRYNEWVAVELLARGEDLSNRKVLDVGAGFGFDAYRHVLAGAQVTALEHNPVLAREGRRTLPMIRWIGAAAHRMPFADGSFDAVFCNAALHHLRDIPASIREMLRVLKPGGVLITSGDPFRANSDDEASELAIFNAHPDVLLGVNEQVPRLCEFVSALEDMRASIEPHIYTQALSNEEGFGDVRSLDTLREWDLEKVTSSLGHLAGSIAMKVRLVRPGPSPSRTPASAPTLGAAQIASWLRSQSHAMSMLAAWAPEDTVNKPFPGAEPDRFDLLNGWQAPTGERWRQAYRRGRWFLRRRQAQDSLSFAIRSSKARLFDVVVNARRVQSFTLAPKVWTPIVVDLAAAPVNQAFAFEIHLRDEVESFEEGLFRVRDRRLKGERRAATASGAWKLRVNRAARAATQRMKAALRPLVRRVRLWSKAGA